MFGYDTKYTAKDKRFVGGSFGFYFTLLKLKELFCEYEVHVVFDGFPEKKFENNPFYKENRKGKYTLSFKEEFEDNLKWVKVFIWNLGYFLYHFSDKEADDVIGSLVKNLTKRGYSDIVIYSTDKDFYQLLSNNVRIYLPKESFRGYSKFLKEDEVLEKFKLNSIKKINWFRAIRGDGGDTIPSINTYYKKIKYKSSIVKVGHYIELINNANFLEEFIQEISNKDMFREFFREQFLKNLNLLELDCSIFDSFDMLDKFCGSFDREKIKSCLEFNSFFRELEMLDKNLRIFKGEW